MDPRGSYVSKILHVKTKESGPVGGARAGCAPLDPPMNSNSFSHQYTVLASPRDWSKCIFSQCEAEGKYTL